MTSSGTVMVRLDEKESLEEALAEIVRAAERELEDLREGAEAEPAEPDPSEMGEIIVGAAEVTLLLNAPGYRPEELRVTAMTHAITVGTSDFEMRRRLACRVEPARMVVAYNNGILSVTIPKAEA